MVVGVRVDSENITEGTKRHCNSSYFTMIAKNEQGDSVPVPGLILENEQAVRRFSRSKQRKAEAFSRDTQYDATQFRIDEHLHQLSDENIKIDL